MTWELAKQLKDAGFPEGGKGNLLDASPDPHLDWQNAYAPTLSELIEACGDGYLHIMNHSGPEEWCATFNDHFCSPLDSQKAHGHGSTPDIAVGKLWLALNSPNQSQTHSSLA